MTDTAKLEAKFRDLTVDWDGSRMADGESARCDVTCGDVRALLDTIARLRTELGQCREAARDD